MSSLSSVVELLRRRAAERPDHPGYTFLADGEVEAAHLTLGELDRWARAVGTLLRQSGGLGERALLLFPPGMEFIAAFFGCLYGGAIAVPAYPPRATKRQPRLRSIAQDSRPRVVLTLRALAARAEILIEEVPELRLAIWLAIDDLDLSLAEEWKTPDLGPDDLAFLQYTSGSTSTPKGVMVSHGNLLHNEEMIRQAFGQGVDSVVVGWLPLYHDMGLIGNVIQPLYAGGRCILLSPIAFLQRPRRWLAAISRYRATTSGGPNFAYDLAVRKIGEADCEGLDLTSWEVAYNGAEPIRADTLERFAAAFAPNGFNPRAFLPCYGLAEATLFVSGGPRGALPVVERIAARALEQGQVIAVDEAGPDARRIVSSGRVGLGHDVRIVDPESMVVCPPGQVGEIWVGGASVAHGYRNLDAETERTFCAYTAEGAGPFLRTGDLGFLAHGDLFVAGRLKDLIILRGRNLYPQDLELTAERSHPALRPGCGAAFAVEVDDEERLVIVQELEREAEREAAPAAASIRRALAEEHEVQIYEIVFLRHGTIAKTSSGKIQRHLCRQLYLAEELAAVDRSRNQEPDLAPPTGEDLALWAADVAAEPAPDLRRRWLESHLLGMLSTLLRQPPSTLNPEQPVTSFGLDSLAAIELQHALQTGLGVDLGLAEILAGPTLRELAERVARQEVAEGGRQGTEAPAPAAESRTEFPLTYNQRALWFVQKLQPENVAYNVAAAAEIAGPLDMAALRRALERVAERHEALRLSFVETDSGPVQRVQPGRRIEIIEEDAAGWTSARLDARLHEVAYRPFDLERDPLLRIAVFRGSPSVLVLAAHHIVVDLWSLVVLLRDLGAFYAGARQEEDARPAPRYTDFALWQEQRLAGESGAGDLSYWRHKLAGELPVCDLATDRPRPPLQSFQGGARSLYLEAGGLDGLKALARAHRTTLYTSLLSAFGVLLYRHGGGEDLLVGSPTAGRTAPGTAEMVGLFVNSVVLRLGIAGSLPFESLLDHTRQTALEAFAHQDYPFPLLVENLQPKREPSRSPVFQVMLALERSHLDGAADLTAFSLGEPGVRVDVGGLALLSRRLQQRAAQFDLELVAAESPRGLGLSLVYNSDLFDATTAERLLQHLDVLLRAAIAGPGRRISELPAISGPERHQLLIDWSDTAASLGAVEQGRCFHEIFEEQVRRSPAAIAVSCGERELTYAELNAKANRRARALLAAGLAPEDRVALWAERDIDFLAAMIAIFKAGGAYLPLDPRLPARRLRQMVLAAGARLVLASPARLEAAAAALADAESGPAVLPLGGFFAAEFRTENLTPAPSPQQLAYVLFTSGSTGLPKGAMIEQRSMLNHLWSKTVQPRLTADDCVAQTATPTFDISIWQFLSALLVGGSVHIVPDEVASDPRRLLAEIFRRRITVLESVPSLLWALVEECEAGARLDFSSLRWLIPTGEALPPELCRLLFAQFPRVPILNAYGPTECADDVSVYALQAPPPEGTPRIPIGRPIANTRLYVLDEDLGLAPIGVPGELLVAGVGVGRGYLGDPVRTAAAFIPDPFDPAGGGRLYRTGDMALRRPDGILEFLGRIDDQVKVRGFRIELGEIEAALMEHPGIHQVAVLAHPSPDGGKRLAAYWTAADAAPEDREIRRFLQQSLPEAMIPAAFARLTAMPLTPSGKVDRRALTEPDWSGPEERPVQGSGDLVDELVAGIFARVLGREYVGMGDDFFALGGHSLLATQVVARLRRDLGVDLPIQSLFMDPTPANLAARVRAQQLEGQPAGLPALRPLPRGAEPPPLSFGQQRLWFLHELEPGSPVYNMPGTVRILGSLNVAVIAASLGAIVSRHESLRTTFHAADGVPYQEISPSRRLELPLIDLRGLPAEVREAHSRDLAIRESRRPFDLSRWPLLRTSLLRLADDDHLLLVTLHHIVSDGWSQGILVREMSSVYHSLSQGLAPCLPALAIQYADYASWQREWLQGEVLEAQLAYWRRQLGENPPALELPLDRRRPLRRTYSGARRAIRVPDAPAAQLMKVGRGEGVTPFMSLLALFIADLHRYSGQETINVGSPIANRRLPELEELIGFFVNTLVLRADLKGAPTLSDLLTQLRQTALAAYAHQDVPLERVVDELHLQRDLGRSPLFQAMFILQNAPAPPLELTGLSLAVEEIDNRTAKFELTLSLEETADGLAGWIEYNTDLFDATTIERFASGFQTLLVAAAASPRTPLSDLPVLGETDRAQLVVEWNDSRAAFPEGACVHHLFEIQAGLTPDALAVSTAGGDLTYRQLNASADRLARTLLALGVGPDVPVGIFAERSLPTVVGLLGVLKAGGAYLPLDPLHPRERLAAMLADSGAPVVVAQDHLAATLPDFGVRVVPLGTVEAADGDSGAGLPVPLLPENLAYVLFTSGSTGRPKGVQVAHRGFVNLLASLAREPFALGGRTLLSITTLAFDIAGIEIFLPLVTGGRVVLADRETILEGSQLAAAIERAQANLLQATPSTWQMLIEAGWSGRQDLTAITGGEALPRELARQLRSRVAALWNGYGPTETTIYSAFHPVDDTPGSVPIGRPSANTAIHLLDGSRQPAPIGVVGEIHIGGEGLARGYIGRPDLTAEKFGPDPWGSEPGARLYRTGDLGRRLGDGRIEYLGRTDQQVKLRGFRIELSEIEAVLAEHPAIERAVVALHQAGSQADPLAGDRRLVAYYIAASPTEAPEAGALRGFLKLRLPDYMVPALFVRLDAIPLNPNGKVDRRALPAPILERSESLPLTGPRNAAEEILAGIFSQVLDLERVDADDDFFAVGGHSLLATRVISRVKASFGVQLPLQTLFENPTVAGLARAATTVRRGRQGPDPRRVPRDQPLPLSFAQERLWVMNQVAPGSPVYNVFQALNVTGPLSAPVLERCLLEVIRRHEVLRTRFATARDGRPVQVVEPETRFSLPWIDLSGLGPVLAEQTARQLARAEARQPFQLAQTPLIRGSLLLLAGEERVLLLTMHHIVCDGWSIGLLVQEVASLYEAFLHGLPSPLTELPLQYPDFAQWQRDVLQDDVLEEELAVWKNLLGESLPVLELPTDRRRPARPSFRGALEPLGLPASLVSALRQVAQREGATLFMTLLASFASVLGHCSGQEDLVIGAPVAGRTRPEIEPLIGFFVNLVPLRLDLSGQPSYRELIARVRSRALAAFDHQEVPFEKLVEAFSSRLDGSRGPLYQAALSMQDLAMRRIALGEGIEAEPWEIDPGVARQDLTLFLWPDKEGLSGACEYATDLFDRTTIARLLDFLRLVLEDMAHDPGRSRLELPPLIERRGVVPAADLPRETNLTAGQLLFWFAPKLQPDIQLYFDRATTAFTLSGPLDREHFERAFRALLAGCDALRTRVVENGGLPYRLVAEPHPDPLEHIDLSGLPDPEAAVQVWMTERSQRAIDLADKPFDSALVRLAHDRFLWFFNVHHIVADAGSLQAIARQLSHLYRLSREDRLEEAEPLPSFETYASEERRLRHTERYARAGRYWEEKLAQPDGLNPFYRDPAKPFITRTVRRSVDLGIPASGRARELCSQAGLFSPAVVFTGALFALLYRIHGDSRLRIGTSFTNRPSEFKDVVGLLMNTCPLRIEIAADETFQSLLWKVQKEIIDVSRHQIYPVRNPVGNRAYNVYINYQTMSYQELCGLPASFELITSNHSNDYLNLQVSDFAASGSFRIDADFNLTAFDDVQGARTMEHLRNLLTGLLDNPAESLAGATMLSAAERQQLECWNAGTLELPRASFSQLFAAQVARTPDAIAASQRDMRLTYRELDERVGCLARFLVRAGGGPEIPVGLLADRGLEFLTALLAILRTGSAYLPLDPHHPPARLARIVAASGTPLVLTSTRWRRLAGEVLTALPAESRPRLLDLEDRPADASPAGPLPPFPIAEGLAYILFTSGSTGVPKGAMVEKVGMLNHLLVKIESLGLNATDVLAQNASQVFDISVWQLLAALLVGGRVHIVEDEVALDAAKLLREVVTEGITVLEVVPSLLAVLLDVAARRPGGAKAYPLLRWLVSTGEALPSELCRRWLDLHPDIPVLNAYGPTECSDDVAQHVIGKAAEVEPGSVPIGLSLPNMQLHVVDGHFGLLPVGVPGELCVGGISVGRGYLRDPARTAEAFVPDPHSAQPGARLYRTGDLVRRREDGALEFLGRLDHQVKVRGFRIELGEIESVLMGFPGVREAVLLAREDRANERLLVAYYVPEPAWGPTVAQLRGYLQSKLPDYMVPAAFVELPSMPLTPNGKVDRRALPPPEFAAETPGDPRVAPRTPLETLIAGICSQVLRREAVGVHDNFFEIGGNSLLATQVVSLLLQVLPIEIDLRQVFEGPTVAKLAEMIEGKSLELGEQDRSLMSEILAEFEQAMSKTGSPSVQP